MKAQKKKVLWKNTKSSPDICHDMHVYPCNETDSRRK